MAQDQSSQPWAPEPPIGLPYRLRILRLLMAYADEVGSRGAYRCVTDEDTPLEFELSFTTFHD